MTTTPFDFLVGLAKASLPSLFVFILGWAIAAWWIGNSQISFSNPVPLIVASSSSLGFLGLQWLWKEKTSWGFWSQERWEDPYRDPELDESTDYGKFRWRLQVQDKKTALVGAWCKKCQSMALLDKHSRRRRVRVICSLGCFRQKMTFKGTRRTVIDHISRQLIKLLAEKTTSSK